MPNPDANDITTFKINLNDKPKLLNYDFEKFKGNTLEFYFDFSTIGSNGHATVHICGPVEGCYIILMYKKLEEFIFNNNNLGVIDNMNNQIVMDKIDDGTSHFTSKFHGSVQNANFVTYLGKGGESARGKLKDDSIEVASLCTSALCNKQEILLLKSSNSTNLFSQSESVTNIDVPILDITLTKRVLIRENTISTFTIFSKYFSNLFQIDTNVNLGRLQGSKGSGNISIGSRSATTPSVYVLDGIRQNYKHDVFVPTTKTTTEINGQDGFTHQGTALPMSTAGMFGHTFVAAKTDHQSGVVVLPNPREIGHRLQIINPVGCELKTEDNDNDETDCDIDIDTRKRFYVDKPEGSYFNAQPRRLQAAANVAIIDCFTVGFSDTIGADRGSKTTETMSLWNCEMANEYGDQSVLVSTDTSDIAPQTYRELSIVGTSKYMTILSPEVDLSVGVAPKNISIKQTAQLNFCRGEDETCISDLFKYK